MTSEALTHKVASLVDLLRENPDAAVSLVEVLIHRAQLFRRR